MARTSGKPRVSLSRAEAQAGAGAELLALCQSITADGSLDKREIAELTLWLRAFRGSDLPAIAFLSETVERIIADGRVTYEEREELYRAIESVLPADARKAARGRREVAKARQHAAELADARERRAAIVEAFDFMVAGVCYEGRARLVERHVQEGLPAQFVREPGNPHDRNAVAVHVRGQMIGYVPRADAAILAPLLDGGHPYCAEIKKVLRGGRNPVPVVVAETFLPGAAPPGAVTAERVEATRKPWWRFW